MPLKTIPVLFYSSTFSSIPLLIYSAPLCSKSTPFLTNHFLLSSEPIPSILLRSESTPFVTNPFLFGSILRCSRHFRLQSCRLGYHRLDSIPYPIFTLPFLSKSFLFNRFSSFSRQMKSIPLKSVSSPVMTGPIISSTTQFSSLPFPF